MGNYRNIDRSDHSSNLLYDFKIIKREKKIIISLNGDIILKMIMMMTMMMTMTMTTPSHGPKPYPSSSVEGDLWLREYVTALP